MDVIINMKYELLELVFSMQSMLRLYSVNHQEKLTSHGSEVDTVGAMG
jgi:hypothetical protein